MNIQTKRVLLVILGLIALPHIVAAQTQPTGVITGVVVDGTTKEPLAAVLVRIAESHRSEPTHERGEFSFAGMRPGTYTVSAERIGYHTQNQKITVAAGATSQARFELHVAAFELAELVVAGALTARSGHELLSAASVVSGAELNRSLDQTVAATVQDEPGVSVTSMAPATGRPVIRGLGGDRILILEDGQRPGDMSSTSADHAVAIDPLTAKQFEVVRGPMSLLYGSSALGGVVNVVREEIPTSIPDHTHGLLTTEGSTVNRGFSGGGYVESAARGFALRAEASARKSGNVDTPSGELINTGAQTFNVAVGAARAGNWGHAGASYRFYRNEYGIPGGFIGGHINGVDVAMQRHTARAQAEFHPRQSAFLSTLSANIVGTLYNHEELEATGAIGTRFAQETLSGELQARHPERGPLTQGAFGFRAQYRDITTGGSLRTPSTADYALAGYVVEEAVAGPFNVQAGARYDWSRYVPREATSITVGGVEVPVRERSFGALSGSIGVLYTISDNSRIGASVARAYRTPDFNELYSDGPHLAANSFDVGNPELRTETGLGFDAFARLEHERIRGEIAVFRNVLSDYIFPSSQGRVERGPPRGRPRLQYANEDARFIGAEGEFEWNVAHRWVVHGTASYVRAEFTSERDSIPLFEAQDTLLLSPSPYPPLIPPLNGRVGLRYESPRYFGGADVRWAADQHRTGDFETSTDGYRILNLNAGLRFEQGVRFHTITLRVENLLDAEYREHLSRIKDIMPQPGRNISLLYRLNF
ncbi:MAG: TonB-dependent receptor [Gemmatimonadota bacterium]